MPKKVSFLEAMKSFPEPAASISGFPREPAQIPHLPALASAQRELDLLRADHKRTIEAQIEAEKSNRRAPLELLGSRVVLEKRIADAERELIALHKAQADENYAADAPEWHDLARQRALLVLSLRRVNTELEARYSSYRSGGSYASPPGYLGPTLGGAAPWSFLLLGTKAAPGRTGLPIKEFLRQAVADHLLTPQEANEDD